MKRIICVIMCLCMIMSLSTLASANQNEIILVGGLSKEEASLTNEDIIRRILDDPTISDAQKQRVIDKETTLSALNSESDIAPCYDPDMEYILDIPTVMQESRVYCGPAVVHQTLRFYGVNSKEIDSQEDLYTQEFGGASSTDRLLTYINSKQSFNTMYRRNFSGQQALDNIIRAAYQENAPIIYTVCISSAAYASGKWPYKAEDGHFMNLCGVTSNHDYLLADPYYYDRYVSGASSNPVGEGYHYQSYTNLIDANSGYGLGYNYLSW